MSIETQNNIGGSGLLNKVINALPFELHVPGYQFCGPGTRLAKRLTRGDKGINPLDSACREHDIAHSRSNDLADRHVADQTLAEKARERVTARDAKFGERAAATAIWATMKAKTKLGMGLKRRGRKRTTRKRRILPVAKRGGILPILPMLGALGALIGGAAGVTKAVNANKAARQQLEEMQRHNRALEGRGLHLSPYKRGSGIKKRKGKKKRRGRKY
jgi:hypothetical protein